MKTAVLALFCAVVLFACQTSNKETATSVSVPTLQMKWKTDTLLTTVESVIYDDANNILYAANINGGPDSKDGNGFISKVDLDGKIAELKWVTDMNAPKGMGIYAGKLYVSDIDRIHEIEIATGKILNSYTVTDAKFLNDIAIGPDGKVYVSDSATGNIVLLENGKISFWLTGQEGPNGLLVDKGVMLIGVGGKMSLGSIDLTSKEVTLKTDSIENPDGIEAIGDGAYLVSSWNGIIHYVSPEWKRTTLLDSRPDSVNTADIEYIQSKNLLLVPNFFKNTVTAYELTK